MTTEAVSGAAGISRWWAGRVDSGPGAPNVHLVIRPHGGGWMTICPTERKERAGVDPWQWPARPVRPVLALVDCPACLASTRDLVDTVNQAVADQQEHEVTARELLVEFLRWCGEEYPRDEGGATLAVYAGGTRLSPMKVDERERAIDLWLESTRRYPGDD